MSPRNNDVLRVTNRFAGFYANKRIVFVWVVCHFHITEHTWDSHSVYLFALYVSVDILTLLTSHTLTPLFTHAQLAIFKMNISSVFLH